jgi:hypothetical protein
MAKYKDLAVQLVIVTAGVFIALFVDSLMEWNQHRRLVNEARANIEREIDYNKKEIESALDSVGPQFRNFDSAIQFAEEMRKTGKSAINQIDLTLNLAEFSTAGWQSAERTGALTHMDYGEVQELSRLYGWQDLVEQQQRRALDRLTLASGLLRSGPSPNLEGRDYQMFRDEVLALRGDLGMFENFAKRLVEIYSEALTRMR